MHEARKIAEAVSARTGLPLSGTIRQLADGRPVYEFAPEGHEPSQTFRLVTLRAWRAIEVSFLPGAYAGPLVAAMGEAALSSRSLFVSVLNRCEGNQGFVALDVNNSRKEYRDESIWDAPWKNVTLMVRRGQLDIADDDHSREFAVIVEWTSNVTAAVLALLPVEVDPAALEEHGLEGWPEGAKVQVTVNRYERDRRNRAAAIAIHGYRCFGCDQLMSDLYGSVAQNLIEIHHTTPVSRIGPDYVLNPREDLVPLCPNCHSVVHRTSTPLAIPELRRIFATKP